MLHSVALSAERSGIEKVTIVWEKRTSQQSFNYKLPMCSLHRTILALLVVCAWAATNARSRGLPNVCQQPPPRSEGICTIEIEGFYYDQRINDCQMYVVGGCRATAGQSFGSRQDCLATCVLGTRRIQDLRVVE